MKRYRLLILSAVCFVLAGYFAHGQSYPRIGYAGLLITNVVGASQIGAASTNLAFGAELGRRHEVTSTSTTVLTNTAASGTGDAIVVIASARSEAQYIASIADTGGNTYTVNTGGTNGTGGSAFPLWIASAKASTALGIGDKITVTWANPAYSERTIWAANVTGAASSFLDVTATNSGFSSSPQAIATTTTATVLVGGVMAVNAVAYTPAWALVGTNHLRTDSVVLSYIQTNAPTSGSKTNGGTFAAGEGFASAWVAIK